MIKTVYNYSMIFDGAPSRDITNYIYLYSTGQKCPVGNQELFLLAKQYLINVGAPVGVVVDFYQETFEYENRRIINIDTDLIYSCIWNGEDLTVYTIKEKQ